MTDINREEPDWARVDTPAETDGAPFGAEAEVIVDATDTADAADVTYVEDVAYEEADDEPVYESAETYHWRRMALVLGIICIVEIVVLIINLT